MQKELSPVLGKDTPAPATSAKRKVESYEITSTADTLALAKDLAKFIKDNRLYHPIQGKEYVSVEGWQYAGSRLGILPIIVSLTKEFPLHSKEEIKYTAKVHLLNIRTEQILGCGFALCSNKEAGKKHFQEFAIASMAQTRAIGKAYRSILAWLICAAGYEPTPAEEMEALQLPIEAAPIQEEVEQRFYEFATGNQKEIILSCLEEECFSEEDRAKIKANLQTLTKERAEKMIDNMRAHIRNYFVKA